MLSPYRVLDLSDERGIVAGMILADLGADVIAIEEPGGNPARRRGPFAESGESLLWEAWARNKRSLTADIETEEGRTLLRDLARGADILIESDDPGAMAARRLGYADLAKVNPALIYVSISAFGQDGPKASYAATDLTVAAASGPLSQSGDKDRAPLRVSLPQTFLHAGAEAAGAALIALRERHRSGLGQRIDVSAQAAYAIATQSAILSAAINAAPYERSARGVRAGEFEIQLYWPAKDGFVSVALLFGSAVGPFTARLMDWVFEAGFCDEAMRDQDWVSYPLIPTEPEELSEYDAICASVEALTTSLTKAELLQEALERRCLVAPVNTVADVAASEQLAAREYWREVERSDHSAGGSVRHPGPFAKLSASPIAYRRPAPAAGEHSSEVLSEIRPGRPGSDGLGVDGAPLAGLKVLDLMWVMAGPATTRVLADYGATVLRVESSRRLDTGRTLGPHSNDLATEIEASAFFNNMNAGKQMVTLDPGDPAGREVLLDLVRWADVLTESFSPRAMAGWDLGYETLRRVNPELIMLSSCLMGQSGPLAMFAGFGNLAAAMAGFTSMAGWPDRPPAGAFGAYSDYLAPRFTVATLMAALEHRDRTGEGQYIDLSQSEAAAHFLTPALLKFAIDGEVWTPDGNNDAQMAPHGVYPAAGDDEWVAIAARDDADWAALAAELGGDLVFDTALATLAGRLDQRERLDAVLSAWTAGRSGQETMELLQARGVPSHPVLRSRDLVADPQLLHRNHFLELANPNGAMVVEGSRVIFSRTPAIRHSQSALMGWANDKMLREILGYDDERIVQIVAAGALA